MQIVPDNTALTQYSLNCMCCGLPLPLHKPLDNEKAADWVCVGCEMQYRGVLIKSAPLKVIQNVRPKKIIFDHGSILPPPRALADFIRREFSQDIYVGSENRQAARQSLIFPVVALPVDEALRPIGGAFCALTRNVSHEGIAIIATQSVPLKLLIIELSSDEEHPLQVLLKVLRCRLVLRFYEIAGQIVTRMDDIESLKPQ
jgi:hypothetical protein